MTNTINMPKKFDYSSSAEFNTAIATSVEEHQVISIDCTNMEYIDSAGIGLLVMANKRAQSKGAKLILINLRSVPREILQLANLQKIIEIR